VARRAEEDGGVREIVQIIPRLPRSEGGVGGYAHALAERLRQGFGIETRFAEIDDSRAADLDSGGTALLHYSNYGYQRRGCPERLVAGLEGWKRNGGGRLVTVFHEVYAGGPPWRSSFWLRPVQRRLAARVARASDRLVTTLPLYAGLVRRLVPIAMVEVAPVFSTVGEPAEVPHFGDRPKTMIVFGGAGVRRRAWESHREDLLAACRSLGIREVLDVGPPTGRPTPELDGIPVRVLGPLPEAGVSCRMLGAAAGFLAYPPAFLPKSTIWAAYCAHGLLPVCAGIGLGDDPEASAAAARAWYLEHSLERQGELFHRLLGKDS
jgi:hypothetical protein